eukprot:jgi/Mesen1/1017/ME000121S00086
MLHVLSTGNIFIAVAGTWAVAGLVIWWDRSAPLGWWTLKPRTQDERAMAHLYQRNTPPFPGDKEEVEAWLQRGGAANTIIPPRLGRLRQPREDVRVAMQEARVEKEASKLWLRMKREALKDLASQGYSSAPDE